LNDLADLVFSNGSPGVRVAEGSHAASSSTNRASVRFFRLMPSGVMPVSLLMWFLVYHYRVAPLRVLGSPLILPTPDNWSHEETDDPLYADRR
jgi:hypothetical protein